jgi:exosortase/archaeosortase family protein
LEGFKTINIFLLRIFGFYFFWFLSDEYFSHNFVLYNKIWSFFYHTLIVGANNTSFFFLNLIGYEVVHNYRSIAIVGSYGVVIGNYCAGFGLMYGCFALFTSYPAKIKRKLWFIPLALLLVYLFNCGRVIFLTLKAYYSPKEIFNEQHDLFNNIIYILVFVLWVIWVKFIIPVKEVKDSNLPV